MRVDMTPILSGKTDRLSFSFDWNGAAELFPDTAFSGPVRVTGSVVNRSGYMLLTLQAEAEYETRCARCLEKLHRKITLDLEKNAALKNDIREDDDDTVPVADSAIELDGACRGAVVPRASDKGSLQRGLPRTLSEMRQKPQRRRLRLRQKRDRPPPRRPEKIP